MRNGYQEIIFEATQCNEKDGLIIEEIMREDIYHSTLDWQTREQLHAAAKQAQTLLNQYRKMYERIYSYLLK